MNYCLFCGEHYAADGAQCQDCGHCIGPHPVNVPQRATLLVSFTLALMTVAVLTFLATWLFFSTAGALRWSS